MELPVKEKGKFSRVRMIRLTPETDDLLNLIAKDPKVDVPQFIRNAIKNEIKKLNLSELINGH